MLRIAIVPLAAALFLLTACEQKKEPAPAAHQEDPYVALDNNSPPPAYEPYEPAPTGNDTASTAAPTPKSSTAGDESLAPAKSSGGKTYVVKKGDTLSSIARKYYGSDKRWKDIYNANKTRISDPNKLKIGTKLIIP